jgi:hypothetical protein
MTSTFKAAILIMAATKLGRHAKAWTTYRFLVVSGVCSPAFRLSLAIMRIAAFKANLMLRVSVAALILCPALCLTALSQETRTSMSSTYYVIKHYDITGQLTYLALDSGDYRNLEKRVRKESLLFRQAQKDAEIAWKESETLETYSGRQLTPRKLQRAQTFRTQSRAQEVLQKLEANQAAALKRREAGPKRTTRTSANKQQQEANQKRSQNDKERRERDKARDKARNDALHRSQNFLVDALNALVAKQPGMEDIGHALETVDAPAYVAPVEEERSVRKLGQNIKGSIVPISERRASSLKGIREKANTIGR